MDCREACACLLAAILNKEYNDKVNHPTTATNVAGKGKLRNIQQQHHLDLV